MISAIIFPRRRWIDGATPTGCGTGPVDLKTCLQSKATPLWFNHGPVKMLTLGCCFCTALKHIEGSDNFSRSTWWQNSDDLLNLASHMKWKKKKKSVFFPPPQNLCHTLFNASKQNVKTRFCLRTGGCILRLLFFSSSLTQVVSLPRSCQRRSWACLRGNNYLTRPFRTGAFKFHYKPSYERGTSLGFLDSGGWGESGEIYFIF